MKTLTKLFSSMIFIFGLGVVVSGCHQPEGTITESGVNPNIAGVWAVTDRNGDKFDITLNKDGTATSTWSVLDQGKWKVVDKKKVHVQWRNGANEFIIVDERGGAQRQTFAPGQSIEGKPNEVTQIRKK